MIPTRYAKVEPSKISDFEEIEDESTVAITEMTNKEDVTKKNESKSSSIGKRCKVKVYPVTKLNIEPENKFQLLSFFYCGIKEGTEDGKRQSEERRAIIMATS